ncbi:MAG: peptide MFS transporter [Bacteroidetes bacterium]|nr:peptide MFS transporter [Bacteroidota bacterium]
MASSGHPKGLYVLFLTEMWERFSYYGMRAIFTLYMTKALFFDKALASNIYGSYTGLVYLTPLLGGYIADRYWGNRRSIIVGGLLMALGQFTLFFSGLLADNRASSEGLLYLGLIVLIFGNGFFKPNISTMVGQLYPAGDRRIDAAFTIFYMGINLGAFFSPLVCGGLGDTGNPADFKWGFLAAGIGMVIGLLPFVLLKDHYIVTPDGKPVGMPPKPISKRTENILSGKQLAFWISVFALLFIILLFFFNKDVIDGFMQSGTWAFPAVGEISSRIINSLIFSSMIAIPGMIISDRSLTRDEKARIWVIFIISFFVIFFWAAFEQAGASLTFFAEEQTDRSLNWHFSANYIFIFSFILFLVLLWIFKKAQAWLKEDTFAMKSIALIIWAAMVGGLAYLNFYLVKHNISEIDFDSLPASYFQSINPLAIVVLAPLFSAFWLFLGRKNLEPPSPLKMAIGLFLLSIGYVVIAVGIKDIDAGIKVSMFWLTTMYLLHTLGELCLSPIGLSVVAKLAPVKFASLLMGIWFLASSAANKLAGALSALYPPGIGEFKIAAEKGVGNLPAILNGLEPATTEQVKILSELGIPVEYPEFLFYQVTNLYDFFMIFVVMSGVAAIALFFVYRKLAKMMHGFK